MRGGKEMVAANRSCAAKRDRPGEAFRGITLVLAPGILDQGIFLKMEASTRGTLATLRGT